MRALLFALLLLATPAMASPQEEATAIVVDTATLETCTKMGVNVSLNRETLLAAITAFTRRHGLDLEDVMVAMYSPYYYYLIRERVAELMKEMGHNQLQMVCNGAALDLASRAAN